MRSHGHSSNRPLPADRDGLLAVSRERLISIDSVTLARRLASQIAALLSVCAVR